MATPIRPEDLPPVPALSGGHALIVDTGAGVFKTTPDEVVAAGGGDPALRAELDADDGSDLIGYTRTGAGAVSRTVQALLRDLPVSVLDYNAVGDGVTDDSAAIQAAIDANKGKTIILPAGYTFLAAGIILSGSSYNGTRIVIDGTFLLKAVTAGGNNYDGMSWNGIVFDDCENVEITVNGMIDGNRVNQYVSEHIFALRFAGAVNSGATLVNFREVMGDGVYIGRSSLSGNNCVNIHIGPTFGENSTDGGRNGISVISCDGLFLAGGTLLKIGGTINANRMPGGLDFEVNDGDDLIRNVVSGPWHIETIGTSGIAFIGAAITNDATRDWNIENVTFAPCTVVHTGSAVGGPILKRVQHVSGSGSLFRTGSADKGISIDYADFCDLKFRASGCTTAVEVGFTDFVNDSRIEVAVEDHTAAGLAVSGANRCRFSGYVRGAVSGSAYGVQLAPGAHGTVTQTSTIYAVDIPYDANNSFGFQTASGMTFTNCAIADCALLGYPNQQLQCGFTVFLPSRNVQGRNWAAAIPAIGYWTIGDWVANTAPVISTGKVLLGWARLTSSSNNVAATDWTPVYGTTS